MHHPLLASCRAAQPSTPKSLKKAWHALLQEHRASGQLVRSESCLVDQALAG